ncbi:MAG TPA: ATP-dependent helicase [Clostridiales bacterium]|nr:ATP-dependent helicase [Clostridiales bacterium]
MELNKGQEEAIKHEEGPMLVLAGPGSGKTFVITERTRFLIDKCKIPEDEILVITFTKAAANEMKERFVEITKERTKVNYGTFHGVFFSILKHAFNYNASNIIREDVKKQFFKEVINKYKLEYEDEKEIMTSIQSEISLVKSHKIDLDNYYSINCANEVFRAIYDDYENKLRSNRLIDFDDMMIMTYDLFVKKEKYLSLWQDKFKYILIDEFQDINLIQYEIIKMLAKPENNIFIVGDDDQSIYRFRGAKPEIMKQFVKDYPESKTTLLDMNYRSNASIVEASLKLVKNNNERFSKKIYPIKNNRNNIDIQTFDSLALQNKSIVEKIRRYSGQGLMMSNIAILVRTNTGHHNLLYALLEYNIPFIMKDAMPNIYEHWIALDIRAYINIAMGDHSRSNYLRVINKPKRYISRDCFDSVSVDLEEIKKYYEEKNWMIERLDTLEYDLKQIKKMSPFAAITYIRRGIDYESYLQEYASMRKIKYDELIEVLDELQESSKSFATIMEWFEHIENYKKELADQKKKVKDLDAVSIITMHGSKGLEFEVVFIADANEDIIPHKKAMLDADIEEERRLFYVAITRAKEYLHIYNSKERYNKELKPSRFIKEIL